MKSDDIRNDPRMKAIWKRDRRNAIVVNIIFAAFLIALLAITFLAGCRWPIVIKSGGTGTGVGEVGPSK